MRMPRVQFASRIGHTPSRGTLGIRVGADGNGVADLQLNGNVIELMTVGGDTFPLDLTPLLGSTMLGQIISGMLTGGIVTLVRDDSSTFDIDLSGLIDTYTVAASSDPALSTAGTNQFSLDLTASPVIQSLQSDVADNAADITVLQGADSSLQTQISDNDTDIAALQALAHPAAFSGSSEIGVDPSTQEITYSGPTGGDITNLQNQITSNDTDIAALQTSNHGAASSGSPEISVDPITQVISYTGPSVGDFANLQAQITSNDGDILGLQALAHAAASSVSSEVTVNPATQVISYNGPSNADIASLQAQLSSNDGDILGLQALSHPAAFSGSTEIGVNPATQEITYSGPTAADITNLQNQITSNDTDIAALQAGGGGSGTVQAGYVITEAISGFFTSTSVATARLISADSGAAQSGDTASIAGSAAGNLFEISTAGQLMGSGTIEFVADVGASHSRMQVDTLLNGTVVHARTYHMPPGVGNYNAPVQTPWEWAGAVSVGDVIQIRAYGISSNDYIAVGQGQIHYMLSS